MIIWLASYPKSGNTWVRSFLNTLIFSKENNLNLNNMAIEQFPNRKHFKNLSDKLDDVHELAKNWIKAQEVINLDKKIRFFKTHNIFCNINKNSFTDINNTLAVIHIVRDPRNVITSIKNHYSKNYTDSLKFLFDEYNFIGRNLKIEKKNFNENEILTLIASWQVHYNSWKAFPKNYYLIKYENLIKDPINEFMLLSEFLTKITNINFKREQILKSIEKNNFENLKTNEKNFGFNESIKDKNTHNKVPFFNLGKNNDWKNLISSQTREKIEEKFYKEMIELGYL